MPYVTVEVDVDLTDYDTEDLLEELERRGKDTDSLRSAEPEEIREMFYAFKMGQTERAIELARKIAQDFTGMILP